MSDKVIRITSQQGFSASWLNDAKPSGLNLLDFTIPRGMNINMEKSYIAINAQIDNDSGHPVNASFYLDVDNDEKYNIPTTALIRNCSISNDKGQVESIRRVDTLSCGLFGLTDEAEERQGNLNTFAQYEGGRGVGNNTSFMLDCVTNNTAPDGTTINAEHTSRNIARDIKVPLKELFGVCNETAYSTDIWGETRIHCETNFVKGAGAGLKSRQLGGAEDTSTMFDGAEKYGTMGAQIGIADGATNAPLQSTGTYGDWENVMPFFVGQQIQMNADAGATPLSVVAEITSIKYQGDNTATPPTNQGKVFITTNPVLFTNGTGSPVSLSNIVIKSKIDAAVLTNIVNRAELVLTLTDDEPAEEITFNTFTSEEDNGNSLTSFNRNYLCEPQANAFLLASVKNGEILPNRTCESYRYAVDNEEMTGNRDVEFNSPLQYDRLQRCLDRQVGLSFKSAQQAFYRNSEIQADAMEVPVVMICETLHETEGNKTVSLEIDCAAGLEQIILYKNMEKTI
tara:strand:+ start:1198 stop:2730 length:1533 start_codon:yes stop_codon:yes gene_type:complete